MSTSLIYTTLPMQQLRPERFDTLLESGFRLLGDSMLQHNTSFTFGVECETIPLRIRLKNFQLSKSQRKILRKNSDLRVSNRPFRLTEQKKRLFLKHSRRFHDNNGGSNVNSFLTNFSHSLPTRGIETALYEGTKLLASSLCHLGEHGVNATYCFFDPDVKNRSLGTFTMLLEIELAKTMGKSYYYLGYTHSLPCQFDYKLGFHNLEKLNWKTMKWRPTPRVVATRSWLEKWQGESIEQWNGLTFGPKETFDPESIKQSEL